MARTNRPGRGGAHAPREQEMRRLVRDQERSGLSQREFCRRHGIALRTLTWWRRRLGRGHVDGAGPRRALDRRAFLEVELVSDEPQDVRVCAETAPIEIQLPGGALIRIPLDVSEEALRRILHVVGRPC